MMSDHQHLVRSAWSWLSSTVFATCSRLDQQYQVRTVVFIQKPGHPLAQKASSREEELICVSEKTLGRRLMPSR